MRGQMTSNVREKPKELNQKLFGDERRQFSMKHTKNPLKETQRKLSTTFFLSDCFVLCLQKRAGSYYMLLSTPAYIFDPIP